MRIYFAKRILFFIPALLFIVLLSFAFLHLAPGDPVERILNGQGNFDNENIPGKYDEKLKKEIRHKLGLDLPLFYFSIKSLSGNNSSADKNITAFSDYIPVIDFHNNNQFHRWLFGDGLYSNGIVSGDFGNSWSTNEKISSIIFPRLKWSLFFTIGSIFLAFLISIPAGLKMSASPNSKLDNGLNILFTIFFSLPAFWLATLLMLLFCNPEMLNAFPSSGVAPAGGFPEGSTWSYKFIHTLPYLVIPTICYTYSSLAFLSRTIKSSVTEILNEDYIRTARAKGLDENKIISKHAFRNTLLPMITIFSHVFPYAIGGSVILESIFTIPGMGLAVFQGINTHDYPVVIAVFLVTGLITMIAFLISDILYAMADPRISYTSPG